MLKRLLLCLTCIAMLLLSATASAAFDLVPVDAFNVFNDLFWPNGLVLTQDPIFKDGKLSFTVDAKATNWDQVVTSAYAGVGGEVVFSGAIREPNKNQSADYAALQSWQATDEEIEKHIRNDWFGFSGGSGDCSFSWPLGSYDPDKQLFIPIDVTGDPYSVTVCWDPNWDQPMENTFQRLLIEVSYTSTDPQPACVSLLPIECIDAAEGSGFVPHVTPGSVLYKREIPASASYDTTFSMPEIEGVDQSGWTVRLLENGMDNTELLYVDESTGLYVLDSSIHHTNPDIKHFTCNLEHLDASEVVRAAYILSITLVHGEPAIAPAGAQPFEADRLNLSVDGSVPGLSVTYDGGHLRFGVVKDVFDPGAKADLAGLHASLRLTPPKDKNNEKATYMGFFSFGGANIYGQQSIPSSPPIVEKIDRAVFEEGYDFFREVPYQNGAQRYFTSPLDYTGDYAGMVAVYYWYSGEGDPIVENKRDPFLVEYVARTYDPVTVETTAPVYEDEEEIPGGAQGKPILVIQDKETNQHTFSARMYPTGEDKHYYELKVLNPNGKEVPLNNAKCRLYLPYPTGYDETNAHLLTFTIHHFNKKGDFAKEEYSTAKGNLSVTDNGLCISVGDLSPFTLEWAPAEAVALPKTGDPSRPLLWLALLSMAAACLIRRVRRA